MAQRRFRRSGRSGRYFPAQGALWLAGAVAITGAPPFGLFLSEFTIMRAGLKPSFSWAVYVMAVLLIVIFIGFLNHFRAMYYDPAGSANGADGEGERLVRRADVAGAGAAPGVRPVVARRHLDLLDLDRGRTLSGGAMSVVADHAPAGSRSLPSTPDELPPGGQPG